MSKLGWFADTTDDPPTNWPWQPVLQVGGGLCCSIDTWFATEADCETFIRDTIIPASNHGMLDLDTPGQAGD